MTRPGRLLAVVALAVALLAGPAAAQTKIPLTREQALAEIKSEDLELRRRAAAWLGELGGPADAPALLGVLADPDEVVRVLAEHSVWQVWSRSGDKDVDAQFQAGIEQMNRGDGPGAVE
ncbi:MAG TPA: HEAT repeat domain-containing protein, partial [Methylomirabilota bacterium]|nr:HEAT repeat domain-containing protein [Methylomirabilota bacterium]